MQKVEVFVIATISVSVSTKLKTLSSCCRCWFFLPLLLSSKQAAKLDTPAQAAIKQKASSSNGSSKRQQHARQQHAARRQQRQRQQHAACGVLRQLQQQLACVVNCTIPRQHSTHTHTGTHTDTNAGTHMWLAKSFLIKLNLMLPNAEALGLFGFILQQIALQTPLLLLLLTTTSNQQRQRQGQGQKQRQRQRQSQSQGSYGVRAGQASVRVRASPTKNANELQNAMQCMHKK